MRTKAEHKRSPGVVLLHHVSAYQGDAFGGGRSNERSSSAVNAAARLAIYYGLKFEPDDLVHLQDSGERGHPDGIGWSPYEWLYSLACGHNYGGGRVYGVNRSFCIAYEKMVERSPFIFRDLQDFPSGRRLCVGMAIRIRVPKGGDIGDWESMRVTSFQDSKDAFVACSYYAEEELREKERLKVGSKAMMVHAGHETAEPGELSLTQQFPQTVKKRLTVTREYFERHNRYVQMVVSERKKAADRAEAHEGRVMIDEEVESAVLRGVAR